MHLYSNIKVKIVMGDCEVFSLDQMEVLCMFMFSCCTIATPTGAAGTVR